MTRTKKILLGIVLSLLIPWALGSVFGANLALLEVYETDGVLPSDNSAISMTLKPNDSLEPRLEPSFATGDFYYTLHDDEIEGETSFVSLHPYPDGTNLLKFRCSLTNIAPYTLEDLSWAIQFTYYFANSPEINEAFSYYNDDHTWYLHKGTPYEKWTRTYGVMGQYELLSMDRSVTQAPLFRQWYIATAYLAQTDEVTLISFGDMEPGETVVRDVYFKDNFHYLSFRGYLLSTTHQPRTYYVDDDGPADFNNIQAAVDTAYDGDTVLVADGTYTGEGNRDIDFLGKAITVKSENGPENCIIDCNGSEVEPHRGFYFHSSEDANSIVAGFTITNAYGIHGGAIYCRYSSPTITNCFITDNTASYEGGGINCEHSTTTISNCVISDNWGGFGGGIFCYRGFTKISNCKILGNWAYEGGGIYCLYSSSIISNCTIADNLSAKGSALASESSHPSNVELINCILWNGGNEIWNYGSTIKVSYSNVQGGWEGQGNVDVEPGFGFPRDCHLMPGSACIDAGTNSPVGGLPATDMDGNPRILDGDGDGNDVADMGAYEYNSQSPSIAVSAVSFSYVKAESNPGPQTLLIRNCGGGTLNWEIAEDCDWLDVSEVNGTSAGNINEVTLTVDTSDLETGSYSCNLMVVDSNAANNPVTVQVELKLIAILQVPEQFDTIQAAVDAANDYDMVLVADGTYTGDGNRDIEVDRKGITVRSENGPENCIIDCNGSEDEPHTGFYFYGNISTSSNLSGFTITNGYTGNRSGGIYCRNSALTISDCNIRGNAASGRGGYGGGISVMDGIYSIYNCTISNNSVEQLFGSGGISCWNSALTVSNCTINGNSGNLGGGINCCGYYSSLSVNNCTFTGNEASEGGAISILESSYMINNCIISNNSADEGGGVYCYIENQNYDNNSMISNCTLAGNSANNFGGGICCEGISPAIRNCSITGNSSLDRGGGIRCYGSSPTITNCTLADNFAPKGSALTCESWRPTSNVELTNCILWNVCDEIFIDDNSTITASYSDIQGGWPGVGNSDVYPCFADSGFWDANGTPEDAENDFWVEGDYHLLPGSLCIDAGDPCYVPAPNETDLDGNPRVINSRIDMGAYEANYIQSRLRILPQVINRHNQIKKVMAWMQLPEGVTKDQIDQDQPLLLYPGGIEAERRYVFEHGKKGDKRVSIFAFFDKSELTEAVPDNGQVQLEVVGSLTTSQQFYGSAFITILDRQQPLKRLLRR